MADENNMLRVLSHIESGEWAELEARDRNLGDFLAGLGLVITEPTDLGSRATLTERGKGFLTFLRRGRIPGGHS